MYSDLNLIFSNNNNILRLKNNEVFLSLHDVSTAHQPSLSMVLSTTQMIYSTSLHPSDSLGFAPNEDINRPGNLPVRMITN